MSSKRVLKRIKQELWMGRSQVFSYMIKQKKPSPKKISKKNLQVCRLEIDGPVGKKISIQQTIEICC